jgi:hypothetical protein
MRPHNDDCLKSEEENSADLPPDPVAADLILGDIVAADMVDNSNELLNSIRSFADYLRDRRQAPEFDDLLESNVLSVLLKSLSGDSARSLVRASLRCLCYIVFTYDDVKAVLLDLGIASTFLSFIDRMAPTNILEPSIWALGQLTVDHTHLLSSFPPPSDFLALLGGDRRGLLVVPISFLLRQFCLDALPHDEVDLIFRFFSEALKFLAIDLDDDEAFFGWRPDEKGRIVKIGREGLHVMIERNLIASRHFDAIARLPPLLEFGDEPDVCAVIQFCEIVEGFFRIRCKIFEFNIRDMLNLCRDFFDCKIGGAAYQLLETMAAHSESDTILSLCQNALPAVVDGIRHGCFQIKSASAAVLFKVVQGAQSDLNCELLRCEEVVPALVHLVEEDEEFRRQALEMLSLCFERSVMTKELPLFLVRMESCDGLNAVARVLVEEANQDIMEKGEHLLHRYCEGQPEDFK